MDVTFVLEESGVTATVEVPCEADAAAAKEVACTALAVSPGVCRDAHRHAGAGGDVPSAGHCV